jgi:hypothetical protein
MECQRGSSKYALEFGISSPALNKLLVFYSQLFSFITPHTQPFAGDMVTINRVQQGIGAGTRKQSVQ